MSDLLPAPALSAADGPLFGRNLDFPTLGYLEQYTLITVYRPTGKRAFASIGFPGLIGVISGMNDSGLAMAILEVDEAADDSPKLDPAVCRTQCVTGASWKRNQIAPARQTLCAP